MIKVAVPCNQHNQARFLAYKRMLSFFWIHAGNIIASGDKTTHALFIEQCYFQREKVEGGGNEKKATWCMSVFFFFSIINDFDWIVLYEWLIFIFVMEQQLTFVIVVWLFVIIDRRRFIFFIEGKKRDSTNEIVVVCVYFLFEGSA
jgi:hypothetical protein